ncbi:B3 domain-containing protein [Sesamum alatum]|uniref:B3 domain-containing protein n=1 Tax=Sesamum alatum TaxID=300844 RepID=A0AAE2CA55_9LAMI|nr:B3 domain-containing protein [Sesamum alatum]
MNSRVMSNPSPMDSRPVTVKEEFINEETHKMEQILPQPMEQCHVEKQKSQLPAELEADKLEEDDIPYLTSTTFFDVVLAKSHVHPTYHFQLPVKIVRELPNTALSVVLRYNRTNWNVGYVGNCNNPRFDSKWRKFVVDNDLEVGDACVFELMERSDTNIRFKVHILRGELPPELQAAIDSRGTEDDPIELD